MQVRWHGHSCFSLVTRSGKTLLIDPYLARSAKAVEAFSPDLVLVTHAHQDHVGSALALGAPILAIHENALRFQRQGATATGMNVGGFYREDGLTIWCAPACHSSGHDGVEGDPEYGGIACGFVIDDGETRFYHAGDTGLFGDMRTVIRDIVEPDAAAVPIGDLYTMGVGHAAKAVEWLGVGVAIPMHYDTFDAIKADPRRFEALVGHHAEVVIPPIDGGVELAGRSVVKMLHP